MMIRFASLCLLVCLVGCEFRLWLDVDTQDAAPQHQPKMIAQPTGTGWMLMFTGFEAAPESMRVKLGDGEFRTLQQPQLSLDRDAQAADVVAYYTLSGEERGPLQFRFDPQLALVASSKQALDMVRRSWVSWYSDSGKRSVVYTPLIGYACALKRVEYGWGDVPDTELQLPPCRGLLTPIHTTDRIHIDAPADATSIAVRLTFTDGEQTDIEHFRASGSAQ